MNNSTIVENLIISQSYLMQLTCKIIQMYDILVKGYKVILPLYKYIHCLQKKWFFMNTFRIIILFGFLIFTLSCSKDDTGELTRFQLNAIYAYQFKNNVWEPTQRDSFTYGPNSVTEYFDYYNKDTKDYYTSFYHVKSYSTSCKDIINRRDDYTLMNGNLVNNIINYYEINGNCHYTKESKVSPAGDSTYKVEYINLDARGNASSRKYYRRNANGALALDIEDIYTWTYYPDKNIKSHTINRKKNNVTTPFNKTEYTYTAEGKLESFIFSGYDAATAQFKKGQENRYSYSQTVNVQNTFSYKNPNGTAQLIRIDSSFLDKNSNIILVKTWQPIATGFAESFKSEYFYSEK
jgi:hypothetical protein